MSYYDDLQQAEDAARARIKDELTAAQNEISAKERDLVNDLKGFKLGIRGPQILTLDANVLTNDPLYGMAQSDPMAPKKPFPLWALIAVAAAVYFYKRKRK